jgi:diguanylate cyclase (GGDEF)-like protein
LLAYVVVFSILNLAIGFAVAQVVGGGSLVDFVPPRLVPRRFRRVRAAAPPSADAPETSAATNIEPPSSSATAPSSSQFADCDAWLATQVAQGGQCRDQLAALESAERLGEGKSEPEQIAARRAQLRDLLKAQAAEFRSAPLGWPGNESDPLSRGLPVTLVSENLAGELTTIAERLESKPSSDDLARIAEETHVACLEACAHLHSARDQWTAARALLRRRTSVAPGEAGELWTDALTQLASRIALESVWKTETARSNAGRCLALLDIDRFQQANAAVGPEACDKLVRAVGRIAASAVRIDDRVGRLAGQRFWLLLQGPTAEIGAFALERVRHQVEATSFPSETTSLRLTVRGGVTPIGPEVELSACLTELERLLATARDQGGNIVLVQGAAGPTRYTPPVESSDMLSLSL